MKLIGGAKPSTNNGSFYTLAGATIIGDPNSQEISMEEDTLPCEDDVD